MSRRTMPYHRRYHGDALQGYRRLTLEQRGAYTTILDLIYDAGGPIDHNERWLAGELNCSIRKARALISELIELKKIFINRQGQISNHRCEAEIENSLKISRKASESVAKREEKRAEKSRLSNDFNKRSHRSINDRSSIPVPEPYKDKDTDRSLHGDEGEEDNPADNPPAQQPWLNAPDQENHPRLAAALARRGSGRAELDALLAARRRRH
ncbi:YdaU family protein [Ensifer sp. NBAIM29]|nr:YdaU family protein [Ensifer sp. NBAIM29]